MSVIAAARAIDEAAANDNFQLNGGSGHDVIMAGGGDDTINLSSGHDKISGGSGNDKYRLPPELVSDFTITDRAGSDDALVLVLVLVLVHSAAQSKNYYLPENFSTVTTNLERIESRTSDQVLRPATSASPVHWNFINVSSIDSDISVEGGTSNDTFGIASLILNTAEAMATMLPGYTATALTTA